MFDRISRAFGQARKTTMNVVGTIQGVEECCYRCQDKANWKERHFTLYAPGLACGPLCQQCWATLQPLERLPFYLIFIDRTFSNGAYTSVRDEILQQVKTAVLAGK